jgi:NADH-quinone oxidoreductase subunit C
MVLNDYKEKVVASISQQIGETPSAEIQYDFVVIELKKSQVYKVLNFLKTSPDFQLDFLTTMCGVHFPESGEKEFSLMYQLHNMRTNERLRLRTYMSKSDLTMPTITTLFPTANWMEREAYDFYGFNFEGHPSLTRILNMDEMNYHPMRREYALEDIGRNDKDDKYFGR